MLAYIKGTVEAWSEDAVVVETKAGIGFEIKTTKAVLAALPDDESEVKFYTYLQVLENDRNIFGFLEKRDLDFFKMLLSVNGIGPKGALSILSALPVDILYQAIMSEDAKLIATANGIGKKTAERVVLELKDKVRLSDYVLDIDSSETNTKKNANQQEVVEALCSLGYSNQDALRAIRKVEGAAELSTEALLKAALKNIF